MNVRCPDCHNSIEYVDQDMLGELVCPSCGSSFSLVDDRETVTHGSGGPTTLSRFKLLSQLGLGAFGSVWQAHDPELDRLVAIKIPRKSLFDSHQYQRMVREARAAAQLRHPNIVAVHEVGRENDTIYIVSDLVTGVTLGDWLTARKPSTAESVELCQKIAGALYHAHQQGVTHRDLKPSNIMIDERGEPRLLDFGLAKRECSEITITQDGQVIGTPAYMSPEQAVGDSADHRCDIYSLGVILFQLLTGERPFRGNQRMLIYQLLNADPPSPRRLNPGISRDLETVVLKCLEKRREQRYSDARALQTDLQNCLAGEPISARPIGQPERVWRWCKRRPAVAALASAVALLLLTVSLGASISSVVYFRQRTAAQQLAEANARLAQTEHESRLTAERNLAIARETVNRYLVTVSNDTLLNEPGMHALRRDLLDLAAQYYQQILQTTAEDKQGQLDVATAHGQLARIELLIESPERAAHSIDRAQSIFESLLQDYGSDPTVLAGLGATYHLRGEYLAATGNPNTAQDYFQKSIEVRKRLVELEPADPQHRLMLSSSFNNLSISQSQGGDLQQAESSIRQAIDILQALDRGREPLPNVQRNLASYRHNLALLCRDQNQLPAADDLFRQSRAMRESLVARFPDNMEYRRDLLFSYGEYAGFQQYFQGDTAAAEENYLKAMDLASRLYRENPNVLTYRRDVAVIANNLAELYGQTNRVDAAIRTIEDAIGHWQRLNEINPKSAGFRQALADALCVHARLASCNGQFMESENLLSSAQSIYEEMDSSGSGDPASRFKRISANLERINIDTLLGQYDSALSRSDETMDLIQAARRDYPGFVWAGNSLDDLESFAAANRGQVLSLLERHEQALQSYDRSLKLAKPPARLPIELARAAALARQGNYQVAMEVARKEEAASAAASAMELARVYAISGAMAARDLTLESAERERTTSQLTRRACQLLGQAKAAGFLRSPMHAKLLQQVDPDFRGIRADAEFQKLVEDLLPENKRSQRGDR